MEALIPPGNQAERIILLLLVEEEEDFIVRFVIFLSRRMEPGKNTDGMLMSS